MFATMTKAVALSTVVLLGAGVLAASTSSAAERHPVSDEFQGDALGTGWAVATGIRSGHTTVPPGETKSQAYNLRSNVEVKDGKLRITTRRHCDANAAAIIAGTMALPENAATHSAPCKVPAETVYSSGRIDSTQLVDWNSFDLAFRAKMPGSKEGLRMALWMRSEGSYCPAAAADQLHELDVLEWYGASPKKPTAVTHIGCDPNRTFREKETWKPRYTKNERPFDRNGFNVFTGAKQGNDVQYLINSNFYLHKKTDRPATHTCGEGKFAKVADCGTVMKKKWFPIIQGEVFHDAYYLASPDDTARFAPQVMVVDWVRITR